jgi:hypothetical protein
MSTPEATTRVRRRPLAGDGQGKRIAAVILEVLAGLRTVTAGAEALGITAMRYHVLERRALEGMIAALQPRPKGKRRRPEDALHELRREKVRLEREVGRLQALVRAAERSMRLPPAPARGKKAGEGRRARRPQVRAEKTIALLRAPEPEPVTTP